MLIDANEISLTNWKSDLETKGSTLSMSDFVKHIHADYLPHAVLIDCTSNQEIANQYPTWLAQGIHIITPNKKANSGSMTDYKKIRSAAHEKNTRFLYETNVGAGLPIINTLRDLVQTGDQILQIEGVFSGTLSYIFNTFSASKAFSEVVKEAKAKGYTEPDPRDDLSGMDVARKLIILAREAGREVNLEDVKVESLVPEVLKSASADEYMKRIAENDGVMLAMLESAAKKNEVLRYVGVIPEKGAPSVELRSYPAAHAFARISGSDNIVAFKTERYLNQPLIIQGPGAGPEVTAAGVFADLLRLTTYLGAPL